MPSQQGKPSEETLALIASTRDGAPMRTECFFCDWNFVGTAGAGRESARTHREQQHPEASVPRPRRTIRMKKRSLRSKEEDAQAALDAAEANRLRAEREDAERLQKILRGRPGCGVNDQRAAWEPHTLDGEQLDLFSFEPETRGAYDEEAKVERVYQMTELSGETWEDAFGAVA